MASTAAVLRTSSHHTHHPLHSKPFSASNIFFSISNPLARSLKSRAIKVNYLSLNSHPNRLKTVATIGFLLSFLFHSYRWKEVMLEEMAKKVAVHRGRRRCLLQGQQGVLGKRIVEQLLAKGFAVKAGVRDVAAGKSSFLTNPALEFVKADVTEGSDKLAEAIGDDTDAVVCATGFRRSWDLTVPWKVDNFGTVNLVDACRKTGVDRFILISSILVNGAAMGQLLNPAYVFLNVFGLVLIAKLQAENYIRTSGINYTIVRPGGLRNDPPSGNIVLEPEDTLYEGSISRDQVAEVAVEALLHPEASYKVVEIIARPDAPSRPLQDLFAAIKSK